MKKTPTRPDSLTQKVQSWWNTNPYSYGTSSKKDERRDVGDLPDEKLDLAFFDEYMRRARKQFDDAQGQNEKLASRFIDYGRVRGKKVLDIACGFGWSAVELAKSGAFVTGIDIAPRAIDVSQRHLRLRGLDAKLLVMDAQKLEFSNDYFDFVNAWGCLMHMPDTKKAISEIYRVLKPNGVVFGYMYNKNSVTYWWHIWFLKGVLMGRLFKYGFDATKLVSRYTDGAKLGGNMLTKVYSIKEAEKMFLTAGFREVKFRAWGPPRMLNNFPCSKLPLGKYLPYRLKKAVSDRWGWGMTFKAQK